MKRVPFKAIQDLNSSQKDFGTLYLHFSHFPRFWRIFNLVSVISREIF